MNMVLKIAFRNIFRQKRRTLLTVLTMFGGFTLASFSIGWSDGTYNYVIDMFTRNQMGHIQIHREGYLDRPSLYKTVDNYEAVGERIIGLPEAEAWAPRLYSSGLASLGDKTTGIRIIGIDPDLEDKATNFSKKIVDGKSLSGKAAREVVIGSGLATILKAAPGDRIVVVSQGADGSIANDLYTVTGIMESGDDLADQTSFYLHLADAQELLVLSGRVHEITVICSHLKEVLPLAARIETELNNTELAVAPWQEFARAFYQAMQADRQGTWIMLLIIILIVAVGVLNTVLMSVLERRREYGVLKAIGMRPFQIIGLIIIEVAVMAAISIIVGLGAGTLINYVLSIYGIPMPSPFTYGGIKFTHAYSEVTALSLYLPALAVAFAAMLVSVFPALKAARVEPARAMRMH